MYNRFVDVTTVQSVLSPGRASQSTVEVDAAECRLVELLHMFSNGELPVVPDTQENQDGIAEHSFSINDDVGLPGHLCTVLAVEGCLAVG